MADLVYQRVISALQQQINQGKFADLKLPNERVLAEEFNVSRSSVKKALNSLIQRGMIFQKQGAGTFINPLYLKNRPMYNISGDNVGVTDMYQKDGQHPDIQVLGFKVLPAKPEIQEALFLEPGEFVYEIQRLRAFDDQPFMIEDGFVPVKLVPDLTEKMIAGSLYNYLQESRNIFVTRSFLTISADVSNKQDQKLLKLKPVEPVGVMEGIFFTDRGTPIEFSHMRLHYKFMRYNTFTALN
ncbi:GntR family transcriptional regulator [Agrilactobacillus composti DSM 18527 = JCM 14202]|uniref:GntR family transcriptional regulator n=1 Tax=Agrilactobacillus composti DSM 18527 = JCM 14202 TaxID=1423734 RepID=X0QJC8_9LACO|nr:GntR family transcriptional regulator [Agrilactobacillus composti]KRM34852.1 GntR family transcriptional regulator [Agrilactobacillus composti DSM 18527 = JCM 14202]MCH4169916.1 GntR family transcriptional regulator [Lactobacillus sp.]GAF38715.1 transcriptional regulator, GntR family [Agrilactobacillus composti DSM 18527 = JCM 14202]